MKSLASHMRAFWLRIKRFCSELRKSVGREQVRAQVSAPHSVAKAGADTDNLATEPAREARQEGERRLGQVLVDLGFLDEDQLWEILDEAWSTGQQMGEVAISRGLMTEEQLLAALAECHGLQTVDLESTRPQPDAISLVPLALCEAYRILPLSIRDNVLTLAVGDAWGLASLNHLRQFLGVNSVQAVVAPPRAIKQATARAYGGKEESIPDLIRQLEETESAGAGGGPESTIDLESLMELQDAQPVRKLINMVMLLAIRDRASDIHFEPFEDDYKMRYRVDGVLYEMVPPPRHLAVAIADRIKGMANLDLAERNRPQHGRIELNVGGNPVDMRVSVLPTMFGESVALRVLDPTAVRLDLSGIGMDPEILAQFRRLIHEPSGVILVTGPGGAGKTTTLYSALSEVNEITRKIITAEDPVEYEIDGIVRCQTRDLILAKATRLILEQDPDIIVVGQIRGHETAQLAMQLALSGRLVLTTLDAADASSGMTRLRGMNLAPSMMAATVKGILAQRLVRKICEDCRTEWQPSPEALMELNLRPADVAGKNFYYGRGCNRCNNTGHRGRCGIFELAVIDDELRDTIASGPSTARLRAAFWAKGMTTHREAGLKSLFSGLITIEEVVRETTLADLG